MFCNGDGYLKPRNLFGQDCERYNHILHLKKSDMHMFFKELVIFSCFPRVFFMALQITLNQGWLLDTEINLNLKKDKKPYIIFKICSCISQVFKSEMHNNPQKFLS